METRLVVPDDVGALAALHSESFGSARWDSEQIAQSLALATTRGWAIHDGGRMLGFLLCQIVEAEAEILTFCTAIAARRRGVGLGLLTCALHEIRDHGVRHVFLEVAATNQAALALYAKKNFHILGHRPGYYQSDGQATDAIRLGCNL